MVYTGRGDEGETDLGSGKSKQKDSDRVEAYGTIDELNSFLGIIASKSDRKSEQIKEIQNDLHILQAELADMNSEHKIDQENIDRLETLCDNYQEELPPLKDFILAGGSETGSYLHFARSLARRTERRIVGLKQEEYIRPPVLTYINRLSDLLFLMGRHENYENGVEEENPTY